MARGQIAHPLAARRIDGQAVVEQPRRQPIPAGGGRRGIEQGEQAARTDDIEIQCVGVPRRYPRRTVVLTVVPCPLHAFDAALVVAFASAAALAEVVQAGVGQCQCQKSSAGHDHGDERSGSRPAEVERDRDRTNECDRKSCEGDQIGSATDSLGGGGRALAGRGMIGRCVHGGHGSEPGSADHGRRLPVCLARLAPRGI